MDKKVQDKFHEMRWAYAEDDGAALKEMEYRISVAGRGRQGEITYSDLVKGIPFQLPGLKDSPHLIDIHNWQSLDGKIVGDFLGYISMRSYDKAGIFASALVVNKGEKGPGEGFYRLLAQLGLIPDVKSEMREIVWAKEKAEAVKYFKAHRR